MATKVVVDGNKELPFTSTSTLAINVSGLIGIRDVVCVVSVVKTLTRYLQRGNLKT